MSNYTIAVNWAGKDALSDSDPDKVISGTDFNTEFVAVRTAVNSKAELNGAASENFAANALTTAGNITCGGTVTVSSDLNLKENIKEVDNALAAVAKIRGVSYNRKDTGAADMGVIAQEVEEVFPELVVEGPGGYKTVNYNGLVGVLLAAVKELYELRGH